MTSSTTTTGPSLDWRRMKIPDDVRAVLEAAPSVTFVDNAQTLAEMAVADPDAAGYHDVAYEANGKMIVEAKVCRVRNGIAVNYPEPYMRRRDPDCMVIGDHQATDKKRFSDRFGHDFDAVRTETFDWLARQDLAIFAFTAGGKLKGLPALAICPANAGFFAFGLAMLQGIMSADQITDDFEPRAAIYVAPPFRHTHFDGKQVVVHHRKAGRHELFSYNLYPGPSAKKGVYGMLIHLGESQGWITAHCSTVKVVTPYDNHVVIMHEGASGGGKSEMLEHVHREPDGRLLLGENTVTGDRRYLVLARGCDLLPVTDDMALCHRSPDNYERKMRLTDAENAWFIRINHINRYGIDPHLERLTVHPPQPLLFLNIDAQPNSTALIWEHIEDEPGSPCPNPRVVVPRKSIPNIIDGDVTVDIRSFGVRTPPCTKEHPSYGILSLFHVLPPALAWLWRLTAPRGHGNPSIVSKDAGMSSEGVGSYWPFATGRRVDQANLLLHQVLNYSDTLYVLTPNQHIGAWSVGFTPQWIAREYLARRGATRFRGDQLDDARCSLLGRTLHSLAIEGTHISEWFLRVETQPEVGPEAYDQGAEILTKFFVEQLNKYLDADLHPAGRRIIECCLDGGKVADYDALSESID